LALKFQKKSSRNYLISKLRTYAVSHQMIDVLHHIDVENEAIHHEVITPNHNYRHRIDHLQMKINYSWRKNK